MNGNTTTCVSCQIIFNLIETYLFKVDCETSYPNIYINHSQRSFQMLSISVFERGLQCQIGTADEVQLPLAAINHVKLKSLIWN